MLSTTPPVMAMWGPWDSCMKRSALWTSKIRYLHLKHTHSNHNPKGRTFDFSKAFPVLHLFSKKPFPPSSHASLLPIGNLQLLWLPVGPRLPVVWNNCWLFVDRLSSQWSALSQPKSQGKVLLSRSEVSHFKCSQHHYGCKLSSCNGLLSLNYC